MPPFPDRVRDISSMLPQALRAHADCPQYLKLILAWHLLHFVWDLLAHSGSLAEERSLLSVHSASVLILNYLFWLASCTCAASQSVLPGNRQADASTLSMLRVITVFLDNTPEQKAPLLFFRAAAWGRRMPELAAFSDRPARGTRKLPQSVLPL